MQAYRTSTPTNVSKTNNYWMKNFQSKSNPFLAHSLTESNDNVDTNLKTTFLNFKSIASSKIKQLYSINEEDYNTLLINNMLFNKNSHLVAVFKDYMIYDFIDEFLKRPYNTVEINDRIPKFANFYKNYLLFFCKPIWRSFKVNEVIQEYGEKKAECYYKEHYKSKPGEMSSEEEEEEENEDDDSQSDKDMKATSMNLKKENIFTNDIKDNINDQSVITCLNNSNFMDNTMSFKWDCEQEKIINGIIVKRGERKSKQSSVLKSNEVTIIGIINHLNHNHHRKHGKDIGTHADNSQKGMSQDLQAESKKNVRIKNIITQKKATGMTKQTIKRIIQKGIVSYTNLNNLFKKATMKSGLKQSVNMKLKPKYNNTSNHNSNSSNYNSANKPITIPIKSSLSKNKKSRNTNSNSNWYSTNSNHNLNANNTQTQAPGNFNKPCNTKSTMSRPMSSSNYIKSASLFKTVDSIWSGSSKPKKHFTKTQNIENWLNKFSPSWRNFQITYAKQKPAYSQSKTNICSTDNTNTTYNNNKKAINKNNMFAAKYATKPVVNIHKSNSNIKLLTSSYNKMNSSNWIKQSNDDLMKLALSILMESNSNSSNTNNIKNCKNIIPGSNYGKLAGHHTNTNWNININNHININTNNSNNNLQKLKDNINSKINKNDSVAMNIKSNLNKLSRNTNTGSGLIGSSTTINNKGNNNYVNNIYNTNTNNGTNLKQIVVMTKKKIMGYHTKSISSLTSLLSNHKKISLSKSKQSK